MEIAEHIASLEAQIEPFGRAVEAAAPDAAVPTCPEWTVRDLVRHTGGVHRWAALHVREGRRALIRDELEDLSGGWPADEDLAAWIRAGLKQLVEDLRAAPADLDCFFFLAAPSPVAGWARRQTHETVIHRIDAESAAGSRTEIDGRLAADGVDELLACFVTRPKTRFRLDPPRTIDVAAGDTGDAWSVEVGPDGITTNREPSADPDLVIRGDARDLYLVLWNRETPDRLEMTGDRTLLEAWSDTVKVRWG